MELSIAVFHQVISGQFTPSQVKHYTDLEYWSSLQSLLVVSAIDEHFNVLLKHEELKKAKSIEELHLLVQSKLNS